MRLTEDQKTIQELARSFAETELAPIAAQIDQEERIPKEIIEKMAEIGFTALNVPEQYGGPELDDAGRYRLLLENLRGQIDRRGKFVSCICCCFPNGDKVEARGECPGTIAYAPKGEGGFGYDPVFFVPGLKKTFAELTAEEKNAISHRGNALNKFKTELENYLNGTDQ